MEATTETRESWSLKHSRRAWTILALPAAPRLTLPSTSSCMSRLYVRIDSKVCSSLSCMSTAWFATELKVDNTAGKEFCSSAELSG